MQIYYWFNYCILDTGLMESRFDGLHGANMSSEELTLVIQKLQELQQYEYCWDRIQNDVWTNRMDSRLLLIELKRLKMVKTSTI